MATRTLVTGTSLVVAAAAVALLLVRPSAGSDGEGDGDDRAGPRTTTADVRRRDLTETEELEGTLGYGDTSPLSVGGTGTITDLADEGAVVRPGEVIAEVDGAPVVLLAGGRPAWRPLDATAADGEDIRQLEQNLVTLGFATAEELGPDDDWTAATTRAVQELQRAVGDDDDGTLEAGSVVFMPGPVRIASHQADVGAAAGSPALEVTGTTPIVTVDLPASDQGLVEAGQGVEVELPDGSVVDGLVYAVAGVVDPPAEEGGEPTVEVVVAVDGGTGSGTPDQAPVDVEVVTVAVQDALTVPVEALLARAEGGYAVERPGGDLVAVEVGAFADGFVQVTPTSGQLREGDEVVVPA